MCETHSINYEKNLSTLSRNKENACIYLSVHTQNVYSHDQYKYKETQTLALVLTDMHYFDS